MAKTKVLVTDESSGKQLELPVVSGTEGEPTLEGATGTIPASRNRDPGPERPALTRAAHKKYDGSFVDSTLVREVSPGA